MNKKNVENARKRLASKPTEDDKRIRAHATLISLPSWPTEKDEDYADRVLRARYYHEVKALAVSHLEQIKQGDFASEEAAQEDLEQTIDGHHDVIYTRCARMIGYVSDYASDALDDLVDMGHIEASSVTPERIAYSCLLHDTQEEIECQAIDVLGMSVGEWFARGGK